MAEKKLRLRVLTPSKSIFDDKIDMVILRGIEGDFAVQGGHIPFTTLLSYGPMRIFVDDGETVYSVIGGFAEVNGDCVTVMTDAAERPDDIDRERALAAKRRAERDIQEKTDAVDLKKAKLALRRALVRIEVSSYPIIRDRTGSDS